MKTITLKSVMAVLVALFSLNANAYDAYIDGIYYNLVSKTKTAEVTSGDIEYIGDVKIPASITYNGEIYSVTSIGRRAFYSCVGLTSIDIAEGVEFIDDGGIWNCWSLNYITIPKSMISIGWNPSIPYDDNYIRSGCFIFTGSDFIVNISDLESWCNCLFVDADTNPLRNARHVQLKGEEITDLIIPNGVTRINDHTFESCNSLLSVTIPNSVTYIGKGAFYGCENLKSVYINDLESWCKINHGDYSPLSNPYHLYIKGKDLKTLIIPDNITEIDQYAFKGCCGITSVVIPNGITSIGSNAFQGCSGLTSVTIPNSVTSIGGFAFANCPNIMKVDIPNNVTSIGEYAFSGCIGLQSISLPKSISTPITVIDDSDPWMTIIFGPIERKVYNIGSGALGACKNVEDVYCYAEDIPYMGNEVFRDAYVEYATLHVPASSIESYKGDPQWGTFGKIVALTDEEIAAYIEYTIAPKDENHIFTIDGKAVDTLQKGVNIIRYTNGSVKKVLVK